MEKIGDIKQFQIPPSIILFAALVVEWPSSLGISLVSACSLSCSTSLLAACSPSCSTALSPCASFQASLAPSFSLCARLVLDAHIYNILSLLLHLAPFPPDFSLLFDSNELFELLLVVFNLREMILAVSRRFQLLEWAIFYHPQ